MNYKLKTFLFALFRPDFWTMLGTYNQAYDDFVNRLLDEYNFTNIGEHTAFLNGYKFWIANYPYSFMVKHTVYSWEKGKRWPDDMKTYRPSRYTCYRAHKKLSKFPEYNTKVKVLADEKYFNEAS
jgi:hypothetical protein